MGVAGVWWLLRIAYHDGEIVDEWNFFRLILHDYGWGVVFLLGSVAMVTKLILFLWLSWWLCLVAGFSGGAVGSMKVGDLC